MRNSRRRGYQKLSDGKRAEYFKRKQDVWEVRKERVELEGMLHKRVEFSGEIDMKKVSGSTALVMNVVCDGVFVDHLWVVVDKRMKDKLEMCPKELVRVFMRGDVSTYITEVEGIKYLKYGLKRVELV